MKRAEFECLVGEKIASAIQAAEYGTGATNL